MTLPNEDGYESGHDDELNEDGTSGDPAEENEDLDDEYEDDNDDSSGSEASALQELESRMDAKLEAFGNNLIAQLQQNQQQSNDKPLTQAELNELYKKDPVKVQQYLIQQGLQQNNKGMKAEVDKMQYDREAKEKYPINDPKFRPVLAKHFQELLDDGVPPHSPRLLLRACKLAASELGVAQPKKKDKTERLNREGNDSVEMSGRRKPRKESVEVGKLPRSVQNMVDLYASGQGVTEKKVQQFAKKKLAEFRAKQRSKRA